MFTGASVILVLLLLYFVAMSISHGFFGAVTGHEHKTLSFWGALVWPLGWVLFGLYVLHLHASAFGANSGRATSDRLDLIRG